MIKEIGSFFKVTAKLAKNKHISDYIHGFQISLVLFLSLAKTMTKITAIPNKFLVKILIEIHVLSSIADSL